MLSSSQREHILGKLLVLLSWRGLSRLCFMIVNLEPFWGRTFASMLCPWSILMGLSMETIDSQLRGLIWIENGEIAPSKCSLRSITWNKKSKKSNSERILFCISIFMVIQGKRIHFFMVVHPTIRMITKTKSFLICFRKWFLLSGMIIVLTRCRKISKELQE